MTTKNRICYFSVFFLFAFYFLMAQKVNAKIFPERKIYKLENGLKVILVEDHKSPVVVFQIWYKVGSRMEYVGNSGLSHLLEHMMFKGTTNMPKGSFSKIVARNGGNENAFTSRDYTAYFEKFSSEHLSLSFKLESDRMQNMLLDPKEFLLERDVVKEERRSRYEDSPEGALYEAVNATAFQVHPYRNPTIGWMTDLNHMTRDDLLKHYKKYYQPANAIIVVVGDLNYADAMKGIRKYFGKIPRGTVIEENNIKEPIQFGERKIKLHKEAKLYMVSAVYHVPNYSSKESYALDVLSQILFAGKSSRMYLEFVKNKKMVLSIDGGYSPISASPGLFEFNATLHPKVKPEEFEQELYRQIEKLKTSHVSKEELDKAKNQVEADFIFSMDSVFYQAMLIGRSETTGAGIEYLDSYTDNIRKVSGKDVQNVAKKYFSPKNRTVGILVPERKKLNKK